MRSLITAAACLAAGLSLAACGSATVEKPTAESSVPPLARTTSAQKTAQKTAQQSAAASAESTAPSASTEPSSGASSSAAKSTAEDRGAHEISSIPAPAGPTGTNGDYLAALSDAGLNGDGLEDQLIGAGQAACNDDAVTVAAVAGQLIEQGRSQLNHEELVKLLTGEAHSTLCS